MLIDYVSWAKKQGIEYCPMTRHCISEKDLEAIAKDQGVEFRPADILIVRSGWIKYYNEATPEERIKNIKEGHAYVGVEGTPESLEWLWDHHFAALAGDTIGFEAWPAKPESCKYSNFFNKFTLFLRGLYFLRRAVDVITAFLTYNMYSSLPGFPGELYYFLGKSVYVITAFLIKIYSFVPSRASTRTLFLGKDCLGHCRLPC